MNIAEALKQNNITQYRLAVQSGVPHATLSDIMNGKTRIEKCSGETLYKLSSALGVTIEDLIAESIERAKIERSWEYGLPEYLQNDLDAYKRGLKEKSSMEDSNCTKTLLRMLPRIELEKISAFIGNEQYLTSTQIEFYQYYIGQRYEKILVAAHRKIEK